jgi:hypothetical protein
MLTAISVEYGIRQDRIRAYRSKIRAKRHNSVIVRLIGEWWNGGGWTVKGMKLADLQMQVQREEPMMVESVQTWGASLRKAGFIRKGRLWFGPLVVKATEGD